MRACRYRLHNGNFAIYLSIYLSTSLSPYPFLLRMCFFYHPRFLFHEAYLAYLEKKMFAVLHHNITDIGYVLEHLDAKQ